MSTTGSRHLHFSSASSLALSALLFCAGCKVGPNYERPEVKAPAAWKWQEPQPDAALSERWWTVFADARLDELQTQALEFSQDLRLAIARVDEARALARISRADFFPQIGIGAGYQRSQNSGNL